MEFLVYKSSAGSGKTYTLVRAYLELALSADRPDYVKHILAITFTNKAAAEMKSRVLSALEEIADDTSGTNPLAKELSVLTNQPVDQLSLKANEVLSYILHHYSDFAISTIDKFSHRIVRTFANDLKLPQNFEVELDSSELLSRSVGRLLDDIGTNELVTKSLVNFALERADTEKNWHIDNDLSEFAKNLINEEHASHLENIKELDAEVFLAVKKDIKTFCDTFESGVKSFGEQAHELLLTNGVEASELAGGKAGIMSYFRNLRAFKAKNLFPSDAVKKKVDEGKWHASKLSSDQQLAIDQLIDPLSNIYHDSTTFIKAGYSNYVLYSGLNNILYSLSVLSEIDHYMQGFKKEHNIVHISEFNRRIAEVVANEPAPFIYERLGEKYKHFLIDEFQDTSVLQWHNLLPLVDNSLASKQRNLIVGDGKQAIYRWRGGDVRQFTEMPNFVGDGGLAADRFKQIQRYYHEEVLDTNYRSLQEVIGFNNYAFDALLRSRSTELQKIYASQFQKSLPSKSGGHVQAKLWPEKSDRSDILTDLQERIEELLERNVQPNEIAILCRTNREGAEISSHLQQQGIKVLSSDSLLLKGSPIIDFIITSLKHINDSTNKLLWMELVVSYTKLFPSLTEHHELFERVSASKKVQQIYDILQEIEPQFDFRSIINKNLIEAIMSLSQVIPKSLRDWNYVNRLIDFAHSFSLRHGVNLAFFIEFYNKKSKDLSVSSVESPDAVQLMTYHKSKGLEFKAVLIPFACWEERLTQDKAWVSLEHSKLGSTLLDLSKSKLEHTEYFDLYSQEEEQSSLDDINILYVAFTRARDELYVGLLPPRKKKGLFGDLIDVFQSHEKWNAEGLFIGEPKVYDEPKEVYQPLATPIIEKHPNWQETIQIAKNRDRFEYDLDVVDAAYGNILHELMTSVNRQEDIAPAVDLFIVKGMVKAEDRTFFEEKLNGIQALMAPFIHEDSRILSEVDLIDEYGKVSRPDKVIVAGASATIIDFKTGEPSPKHKAQINDYGALLAQMGYEIEQKVLLYTEQNLPVLV